jgi:hypothetical protein
VKNPNRKSGDGNDVEAAGFAGSISGGVEKPERHPQSTLVQRTNP